MLAHDVTYVQKVCAYVTRGGPELLVFEGPDHDGFQIPKRTVEPEETPRSALNREVVEESGLETFGDVDRLVTDVWTRRESPPKRYVRHFYHVRVHESRDAWTHTVTGTGPECGAEFAFSWLDLGTDARFALDLDDYLDTLTGVDADGSGSGVAAD